MSSTAALKLNDETATQVTETSPLRPLDSEAMELLELFTYTQQKINDHLEKVFAGDNLSLAHYRALFFVMRYPGISVSGLIDKLDITKQSLARVLADLIRGRAPLAGESKDDADLISSEDGFLYSEVDENDRRSRRLYLTKRGDQLMLEALNPVTEALRRSFNVLEKEEK
jgi:DNA-binding MarR family transcriptional regulator